MKFCNLALVAFSLSSMTNSVSAFVTRPRHVSVAIFASDQLSMISANSNKNVVAFTTTIHREEVDLESLSLPQLQQMHLELEQLNSACTEECTQTNPECDVELKDERDYAIVQIQSIVNERTGKNSKHFGLVDMDSVRAIVATPWTYSLATIGKTVTAMEKLNYECTEDGNQTDSVCDVQLKDERDAAIETLGLYKKSVQKMLATEGINANAAAQEEATRTDRNTAPKICKDARVDDEKVPFFDMGEIRDAVVDHPGSKSLTVLQTMLMQLEAAHNACTEEGTQTNPECDLVVKAERDMLMESLVSQIHDAKLCMDQIKAFASSDNLDQVAMEDVMNTVINTIPNLPSGTSSSSNNGDYVAPTDEFLVQI